jgi:putative aminopeptidase FrvX
MTDILPFLKSLLSAPGLSAYENPVAALIAEEWKPLVDEINVSKLGSLHALKRGMDRPGAGRDSRARIMIAAHMDAIGMMVTQIRDGFLYVTEVGGLDARVLPATPVSVHASGAGARAGSPLPGVVAQPPSRTLPPSVGDNPVPLEQLVVDTGLAPNQVNRLVRVGDLVSFATEPAELAGDAIAGHSLDNRASVAAVTVALEELQGKSHAWDVWAVATSQEEVTLGGAQTSAFDLRPDIAVVLDVTFAKGPGASDWSTHPLGKGPTIGHGPNLHPFLFKKLDELAERLEIPHGTDVIPRHSGTDAYATQVTREGIPTALLEVPLRYMHTPVEVVSIKDIQRAGRLLAEFIIGLEPDFVDKITWED